ncbi:unnamed protein product, partial [Phaeothamnion confervicola]
AVAVATAGSGLRLYEVVVEGGGAGCCVGFRCSRPVRVGSAAEVWRLAGMTALEDTGTYTSSSQGGWNVLFRRVLVLPPPPPPPSPDATLDPAPGDAGGESGRDSNSDGAGDAAVKAGETKGASGSGGGCSSDMHSKGDDDSAAEAAIPVKAGRATDEAGGNVVAAEAGNSDASVGTTGTKPAN